MKERKEYGYQEYVEHGKKYRQLPKSFVLKISTNTTNVYQSLFTENLSSSSKKDKNNKDKKNKNKDKNTNKKKKNKEYIPRYEGGNWCILYALAIDMNQEYKKRDVNDSRPIQYTKDKIFELAQPFCVSSFTIPDARGFTAGDIQKLIDNGYMIEKGSTENIIYKLTPNGYKLGQRFVIQYNKKDNNDENYSIQNRNTRKRRIPLNDVTDTYQSPKPLKRRRICHNDIPTTPKRIGSVSNLSILNGLDEIYNIREPIIYNNKRYILHLNIDSREASSLSKQINSFKDLKEDGTICVDNRALASGDFLWLLVNADDPKNDEETLILPFIIERKTWSDLYQSIKSGRYHTQKYVMSWIMENDTIIRNGRKMYLVECPRKDLGVQKKNITRCIQACVETEARDNFFVYKTKSKQDTQRTLIKWTYQLRQWIDDEIKKDKDMIDKLTCYAVYDMFRKNNLIDNLTARLRTMQMITLIPECTQKIAFYVTEKYDTMRKLYDAFDDCIIGWKCLKQTCGRKNKDRFNFCPKCGTKKIKIKPELLLHHTVFIYDEWKYKTQLFKKKLCNEIPDSDIHECLFSLRRSGANDGKQKLSKELSRRIYKALAGDEVGGDIFEID